MRDVDPGLEAYRLTCSILSMRTSTLIPMRSELQKWCQPFLSSSGIEDLSARTRTYHFLPPLPHKKAHLNIIVLEYCFNSQG